MERFRFIADNADQSIHGMAGLVNLFGIESPVLTGCLALAERVVKRLNDR
ncbi:hypothetical protein WHX55_20105 [Pseudomonas fluorescens]|nr:hypothetical protein [Pseudomonas fluorescens]